MWEHAWKFIQTHDTLPFSDIAVSLSISEEKVRKLSMEWALGNRNKFKEIFESK